MARQTTRIGFNVFHVIRTRQNRTETVTVSSFGFKGLFQTPSSPLVYKPLRPFIINTANMSTDKEKADVKSVGSSDGDVGDGMYRSFNIFK